MVGFTDYLGARTGLCLYVYIFKVKLNYFSIGKWFLNSATMISKNNNTIKWYEAKESEVKNQQEENEQESVR